MNILTASGSQLHDADYEGAVEGVNGGPQHPEHLHCLRGGDLEERSWQ